MAWAAIGVGVVTTGVKMWQGHKSRKAAEEAAEKAEIEQQKQQKLLDQQKQEYKNIQYKNPYENMENVYEDLTVNTQQAEFEAQQGDQQRANIMQSLGRAAGGSGIAALAQEMANQGQLQTQRISASIGQQEAANQKLAAQGAGQVQQSKLAGDQWVQQQEIGRTETLLGMQMGGTAGANRAAQQAKAMQMQTDMATREAEAQAIGELGGTIVENQKALGNLGKEGYNWKGQQI